MMKMKKIKHPRPEFPTDWGSGTSHGLAEDKSAILFFVRAGI